MLEATIAIGLLAALAAAGWWKNSRSQKQVGKLENKVKTLEEGADAHEREHAAVAEHERVGDLTDDERFLPPSD